MKSALGVMTTDEFATRTGKIANAWGFRMDDCKLKRKEPAMAKTVVELEAIVRKQSAIIKTLVVQVASANRIARCTFETLSRHAHNPVTGKLILSDEDLDTLEAI